MQRGLLAAVAEGDIVHALVELVRTWAAAGGDALGAWAVCMAREAAADIVEAVGHSVAAVEVVGHSVAVEVVEHNIAVEAAGHSAAAADFAGVAEHCQSQER